MSNVAILVGNSIYDSLRPLPCCLADVEAIRELLVATGKYEKIILVKNASADDLKTALRAVFGIEDKIDEAFFYFTGHGSEVDHEFFHCATNYDRRKPNESGLSTTELHTLLKATSASLVVKVVDACNSGTSLIKRTSESVFELKDNFPNLIQIAACLDSQNSLGGDPLSKFTKSFYEAALRKEDGIVYFTDIINTLRDEYIEDNLQTPFFVSQHTGREQFVDDAKKLTPLRERLVAASTQAVAVLEQHETVPPTLQSRLRAADAAVATPELISALTLGFFKELAGEIAAADYTALFESEIFEYSSFDDSLSEEFMLSILCKEKRPDEFVTAISETRLKDRSPSRSSIWMHGFIPDTYEQITNLRLNYRLEKAQMKIVLTPKFVNLQKIVIVCTCAPSLDNCYIFEYSRRYLLTDFGKFESEGSECSRRWWRLKWKDRTQGVATAIGNMVAENVRLSLEAAEQRLLEKKTDK